jgi:hypothetical protein
MLSDRLTSQFTVDNRFVFSMMCCSIQMKPDEELVHVYFSSLNFRDVMVATGRITVKIPKHRLYLVRTLKFIFIYTAQADYSVLSCGVLSRNTAQSCL